MLRMTGYGKGEYIQGGLEMTVEIKTVNNRYLYLTYMQSISCEVLG